MRVLLDESVPAKLRSLLPGHTVETVPAMGWSGTKNGQLLRLASNAFDVFVTVDKNLRYQQNLYTLPIAVVILDTNSNDLASLVPLAPKILHALQTIQARSLTVIAA